MDIMDNEKLIAIVKEYKYLYDLSHKKYSDNQKKKQAWKEIGIKLKRNGAECKKTWTLLRDSLRRCIKKRKHAKSGQDTVPKRKWKYEDEMSFLLPYLREKPTPSPTELDFVNVDYSNEEEDNAQSSNQVRQQSIDSLPYSPEICEETGTLPYTSTPAANQDYSQLKCTKRKEIDTPSTVPTKYIIDSQKNTPLDDIEQFMAGITTTVRSFSPRDRAIAKAKIFEIVSRMEIDILSRPSSSHIKVSTPSP